MENDRNRVCPVERASSLDGRIRRWLHNPHTILAPFVKEGMSVLDVGCGPGLFSIEMAQLVGPGGHVISADLQEGMLSLLTAKIKGTPLESRIRSVQCDRENINVSDHVDFILAFYMAHEVPDQPSLFKQLKTVINPRGQLLLVEPKLFHVTRREFESTLNVGRGAGFTINKGPKVPLSWSAILTNS